MITDSMFFFSEAFHNQKICQPYPKYVSTHTRITQLIQKRRKKKYSKAITVLQKEGGGGPARYDHDHRFNGFFFPFPKGSGAFTRAVQSTTTLLALTLLAQAVWSVYGHGKKHQECQEHLLCLLNQR